MTDTAKAYYSISVRRERKPEFDEFIVILSNLLKRPISVVEAMDLLTDHRIEVAETIADLENIKKNTGKQAPGVTA